MAMAEKELRKIKICLVGDIGVGKTSLIRRYVLDLFDDKYIATIGTKVTKKMVPAGTEVGGNAALMIWDIMGQPSFREILREAYFYGAQGALCVCDITSRDSLGEMRYWIKAMTATAGPIPMVVIGNKADLKDEAQIEFKELEEFSSNYGSACILTSAKTGENVEKAFIMLVDRIMQAGPSP